jgi:hypothetical protein
MRLFSWTIESTIYAFGIFNLAMFVVNTLCCIPAREAAVDSTLRRGRSEKHYRKQPAGKAIDWPEPGGRWQRKRTDAEDRAAAGHRAGHDISQRPPGAAEDVVERAPCSLDNRGARSTSSTRRRRPSLCGTRRSSASLYNERDDTTRGVTAHLDATTKRSALIRSQTSPGSTPYARAHAAASVSPST